MYEVVEQNNSLQLEDDENFCHVVLLNDDVSPMDFVVWVLQEVFHYDETYATQIMYRVHYSGSASCGLFSFEIAEMKQAEIKQLALMNDYPLQVVLKESYYGE